MSMIVRMMMVVIVTMSVMIVVVVVVMKQAGLQVGIQVGLFNQFPDLLLQQRQFGRIEYFHLIVFIHQLRQLRQRAVSIGGGHRRRQVVDDDGMGAALGLRAFAGIVDNERIKQGQVGQQRIGKTLLGQAHAFARQPFQRAVFAYMDDGVGLPVIFQPAIQRVIMMRRRQIGLVVDRIGIHAVAARRLQYHQSVA